MIYVQRNSAGKITIVCAGFQTGFAEEALEEDNIEVVEFFNQPAKEST